MQTIHFSYQNVPLGTVTSSVNHLVVRVSYGRGQLEMGLARDGVS